MADASTSGNVTQSATRFSRRLLAGALAGFSLASGPDSGAGKKRKKKCKRGTSRCGKACCVKGECVFKVKKKRWLLQSDCTITRTIEIQSPAGLVIDGQNHTISMSGPKTGFHLAGLLVSSDEEGGQVDIANLTVNGAAVTGVCSVSPTDPLDPNGIYIGNTSGKIDNVTLTDIPCTRALAITNNNVTPAQTFTVNNIHVATKLPAARAGLGLGAAANGPGRLTVSVTGSTFADSSVDFNSVVTATVDRCTLTKSAIAGLHGARVTVKNSKITNTTVGIYVQEGGTTLSATGNTVTGTGSGEGIETTGIDFRAGSSGSASGNAISNYLDSSPGNACGIRVAPGVSATIGSNTFPAPGNEFDVCNP